MSDLKASFRMRIGLLLSLLLIGMMAPLVSAAEVSESITLSPTSKHYQLKAGQTAQDQLTVVNDGKTDYNFRVYADPYSVRDENYDPDFSSMRKNTSIPGWVDFEKDSYFIKAGETITVKYSIAVPKGATPGGHYGVLFAETQPSDIPLGNSIARKKRVGAIVYATVEGTYKTGGKVAELSVPALQFIPPLQTTTRIENSGNTDFAATTSLLVTDVFGTKKFEDSKVYQVLPESTRKITMQWPQSPGYGLFKVTATAAFLTQNSTKTTYVLLAPVWAYLVAVLGVLIGIIYLVQKRR